MFLGAYKFLRRLLGGRGLSRYNVLRNLNHRIKKFVYGKPKEFIVFRGFKFFLDPKNTVEERDIEGVETKLVEVFLKPGDVFVDVGAHLGWFSVIASRIVGDKGKVFAFEPNHKSYNLLKRNLAENKCANVVAENVAVSDNTGECSVYTLGDLWFGSSLIDPRKDPEFFITPNLSDFDDKTIYESKVRKTSLDAYFGNQRVDFVKTDTEGHDGRVWVGMQNLIQNNPQIIIYMEFAPTLLRKFGTEPEKLLNDIQKLRFNIFMTDGYNIKPFERISNFSGNLFFTRRDIYENVLSIKAK